MTLSVDLRKMPLETQAKMIIARDPDCLHGFLASHPSMRHPICAAAYDLGYREFAVRNAPLLDAALEGMRGKLVAHAKEVCGTSAPVDMVVRLSTIPIRNRGVLYERREPLLRMNFSDGKAAYCKSRNALQESVGLKLLAEVGLPAYSSALCDGWIVLEGVEGRALTDHVLFPGADTASITGNRDALLDNIIAVVAFDRIFGMVDRNERGLVISHSARVTAIDHEYLLVYPKLGAAGKDLPAQGRDLLNFGLYLNEIGIGLSVPDHLAGAAKVFRLARERMGAIAAILGDYVDSKKPVVDMTIGQVRLGRDIVANAQRIIEGGLESFSAVLAAQMDEMGKEGFAP